MLRIPETDPIEFLVERKFPNYQGLRAVLTSTRECGNISRDSAQEQLKEVAVYQAELKAKPREELLALYEELKEKHRRNLEFMHSLKGREHQFRQSTSDADFDRWSKASHWSLDEAVALSFGRAPEIVNWVKLKDHASSPFVKEYRRVRNLVIRARNFNQLNDPTTPGLFLAWAKRNDIDLPPELLRRLRNNDPA